MHCISITANSNSESRSVTTMSNKWKLKPRYKDEFALESDLKKKNFRPTLKILSNESKTIEKYLEFNFE